MTDKKVESVPLPEDDERIAQEVTGAKTVIGGGEWPSPSTPPTGPSPGGGEEEASARDAPGRGQDEPMLKEMLDADPIAGGSQSTPEDDDESDHLGR